MFYDTRILKQLQQIKTGSTPKGAAKALLARPDASAVALVAAARALIGDFEFWEPEAVWHSASQEGVEVPAVNRAKLLAAATLLSMPSFYWDGIVFEKTALAFDGVEPNPDTLQEATSAQLAWAVKEAAWILAQHSESARTFEHEPAAYASVVLHREGLVLAPEQLSFAQDLLDKLNADKTQKSDVEQKWKAFNKERLKTHTFTEEATDVQLARLAAIELHVRDRETHVSEDLAALR